MDKPNFLVRCYSYRELEENLNALFKQGYEIFSISFVVYQNEPLFTVIAQLWGTKRI